MTWRSDPGDCLICGAAHTSCTGDADGVIVITQTPAKDAAERANTTSAVEDGPSVSEPRGPVTTGTYPRRTHRLR
jgi:regulator of RNase E activity RraA